MVIGTSNGKMYEDMLHLHATPYFEANDTGEQKPELDTLDQNIVTPDQMQKNKAVNQDPKNIYDDQGNIVDYDFWNVGKNGVLPYSWSAPTPGKRSEGPATVQTVGNEPPYTMNPMMDSLEGVMTMGGGNVSQFRPKPSNDNAKDSNGGDMTRIGQLAKKLGEAENGPGSWNRIGGGGQEHYYRDARRALKNDKREDPAAYNPKDPSMIGSKEQDAAIDKAWGQMVQKNKDELPMLQLQSRKLQADINKDKLSDFELTRFNKLKNEWKDKYGSNWDPNDNILGP